MRSVGLGGLCGDFFRFFSEHHEKIAHLLIYS
jgi:hypothetical protein